MIRFIPILFLLVLWMGCGSESGKPETSLPADQVKPSTTKAQKEKAPDLKPWLDPQAAADFEAERNLAEITRKATEIDATATSLEPVHSNCKSPYGKGIMSVYKQDTTLMKIRVDWVVEKNHSQIEYYFDQGQLILVSIKDKEFRNFGEAEKVWLDMPETAEPIRDTEGRYYLVDEKVTTVIARSGETDASTATFEAQPDSLMASMTTSIEGDLFNLRQFADGKINCEQLISAGYFP